MIVNPYEFDESPIDDSEHFSPCGCGDSRCHLDDRDSTNVNVNGKWYVADCVGLCLTCGEVDDLHHLMKMGGGCFAHKLGCPDRMNERRR